MGIKNKNKKIMNIMICCCILLMILVTVASLVYFKQQVHNVALLKSESEEYASHYAFIASDSEDLFFQAVYDAAKEQGKKTGDYIEFMGKNLTVDYSKQELLKIAIYSKVDGIIVEADESQDTVELINQAVEQGIPVITVGSDCTGSTRQSYVGIGNYNVGQEYGKQILKLVKDEVQTVLVLMSPNADDSSQNIIYTGIKETIAQSQEKNKFIMETVAISDESNFGAEESVRSIIMREREIPDIMICLNELNTNCAYQAIVDYNKVGSVNIFGYYENKSILDAIKKRIITSTISIDTKQMGQYCVKALDEYRNSGYVNEYLPVDIVLITLENVGDFISNDDAQIME
jgi:ribose transport system substrate-binding protein